MSLLPSLAEEWFVRDALAELDAVCPVCRARLLSVLNHLSPGPSAAFAEVFRLSQAIRVQRFMAGNFDAGRRTDDWESLRLLMSIHAGISVSLALLREQS
ncbi:hypothetical protein ACQVP2_27490 [Methylobacterium aquaticum]|jgi:hypothetical protein|uniref:hypothetical protein n=1 Tax=Methylobacterium aquaticum TaxID=270351 RepID=UPI003D174330